MAWVGLAVSITGIQSFNIHLFSENRYLLFLTENYAALNVLEHYLKVEDLSSANQVISKPFILFGSSFPKDKDYTQVLFTYIMGKG